jgi:hypothetical protein
MITPVIFRGQAFFKKIATIQPSAGDSGNRWNAGAFSPGMRRLGAKGLNAAARRERLPCPFAKAPEDKKSFEITPRLDRYKKFQLICAEKFDKPICIHP